MLSVLPYGCTTWTLTKSLGKKLDGNCRRMLCAVLKKSWKQHLTKQQMYGHLPPISQTIQERGGRHVGHCLWSKDEFISNALLWTTTHGHTSVSQPAKTYIHQLCMNAGGRLDHLPRVVLNRDKQLGKVKGICVVGLLCLMKKVSLERKEYNVSV